MTTTISVGVMGFSQYEEMKFKKIVELSQNHKRAYRFDNIAETKPVDLLIVKEADEFVLRQQQAYQARHKNKAIQVVKSGREPIRHQEGYYIRGILIPSRVFAVLDNIEFNPDTTTVFETKTADLAVPELQPAAAIAKTQPQSAILQVLVVDDSVMMQKTIQMELNKATIPLAVDFADTGEMALEKVKLKKYNVIFLDVMMPGIDGFETCTQIRKFEGMAKTPIIMLTSKTSAMDEVRGLVAGCTTYLTKPFVHDEFQKMLERIMQWAKEFNDRK
jgi:twitching motility two-component system response regulator PilG